MSNVNEVKGKVISKNQEIVKLQSEQAAIKIEIEREEVQLKSLITLMDDFSVIFPIFLYRLSFYISYTPTDIYHFNVLQTLLRL